MDVKPSFLIQDLIVAELDVCHHLFKLIFAFHKSLRITFKYLVLIISWCLVLAIVHPLPDFDRAKKIHQEEQHNYMNSFTASAAIGMNAHLFNRITGVVFVYSGEKRYPISDNDKKVNIGLQLKHFKQVIFSPIFRFLLTLDKTLNISLLKNEI